MIYDISPTVSAATAVFPGDVPFQRRVSLDFQKGHHLSLSSIQSTLHIGAHADAPSHYHPEGRSIDQCPIENYLGLCQVIDVRGAMSARGEIHLSDLMCCIEGDKSGPLNIEAPRILFKTGTMDDPTQWKKDFGHLSVPVVEWLAAQNVILVGIDTPSVDFSDSKNLDAHRSLYQFKISILEGLDLSKVSAGIYHLIALPLKLAGAEASPVRAILVHGHFFSL